MYYAFNKRVETFSHNTLRDFLHVSKRFKKSSFLMFFPKFTDSSLAVNLELLRTASSKASNTSEHKKITYEI
jgi:hypothetical protein